jgi:hypothetical protein
MEYDIATRNEIPHQEGIGNIAEPHLQPGTHFVVCTADAPYYHGYCTAVTHGLDDLPAGTIP